MKISRTKLIAYLAMVALLASLIVSLLGYSNTTRDIELVKNRLLTMHVENNINLMMKYLQASYGNLSAGDGTLLDSTGKTIEGRFTVVDSVMEDLGDKSTIFVKENDDFRRVSTNIMSDDKRALDTYLGRDHNAYETVMRGEIYMGEAEILGDSYYTAYEPIKDTNNNVIGLLFVGMPTEQLDNLMQVHDDKMGAINIAIIVLRAISLGALIILITASIREPRRERKEAENNAGRRKRTAAKEE